MQQSQFQRDGVLWVDISANQVEQVLDYLTIVRRWYEISGYPGLGALNGEPGKLTRLRRVIK